MGTMNNVLKLRQHRFGRNVSKSDRAVFHELSLEVVTSRQREQYFSVGHETHAPSDQIDIILHVAGEKGWNSSGERMRRGEHWRIALTGGNASGDEHHRLRPSKAGIKVQSFLGNRCVDVDGRERVRRQTRTV